MAKSSEAELSFKKNKEQRVVEVFLDNVQVGTLFQVTGQWRWSQLADVEVSLSSQMLLRIGVTLIKLNNT